MNRGPNIGRPPEDPARPKHDGPAPVVIGDVSHDGRTVTIRCPFCRRRHSHGTPEAAPAGATMRTVGARLSHCTDRPASTYRIVGRLAS